MKKLGLWLMTILVACLAFVSVACSSGSKTKDQVTLSETAITLEVGASHTLTATTNAKNGVTWSTSDPAIATVDGGVVDALSVGTATITATAGKATATCTVTVKEAVEYAELTVDKTLVELREGGASISVTATFTVNDEPRACDLVWTSENETIATVEDGKIVPVGVGSTIVTVSVEYKDETYSADVNVVVKPDEQIQVSKGTIELSLIEINGGIVSDTFTATAYKAGVENDEVTLEYVSSDENVATVTVEAGVATVTSVGEGTCTISVSYTSAQGKIETLVKVTVSRSALVLDEILETPYVEGNTVLDFSALELQGAIDGVYFEGKKVASEDGVLDTEFVESNKGYVVNVELRTNVAIYSTQLYIVMPFVNVVAQGSARTEMPVYEGDATELGFAEGTEVVYELITTAETGWDMRLVTNVDSSKDYVKFDLVLTKGLGHFTMWPEKDGSTLGSYIVTGSGSFTEDADPDRQIYVVDQDGYKAMNMKAGVVYTVYFYLNKGETLAHVGAFSDTTMYIANIECANGVIAPQEPENVPDDGSDTTPVVPPVDVPDYVMQGDSQDPKAAYEGDVTALGFAAGTTVYEIVNTQEGQWDDCWDTRLILPLEGTQSSVAIEFVATKEFAFSEIFSVWGVAGVPHMGTVNKTGIAGDWATITDVDGNQIEELKANTLYVLHIACENLAQVQVGILGENVVYIGNFTCNEEDIPVFETPTVMQGDARLPMPEYDGSASDLGFDKDTDVVYELVVDAANNKDGWTNRMIVKVDADKDVLVFDVIVKEIASTGFRFTMWPEGNGKTLGSYGVSANTVDPSADADSDRKIFILGADGKQPSSLTTGTLYTVYFFLNEGETHVHFSTFTDGTVHIANIRYINADEVENDPTLPPPPISQGEARNEMPTFAGDVTTLGFEEGTVVYQIVGPQSSASDVKLVAQVDSSGDNAYAKLDFVLSAATSSLGLWITAENSHLGYYTVTPTEIKVDGIGDPSRVIFVTDANGEKVQSFEANKVYTLYIGLDGREATVQLSTWAELTVYVANIECITEDEAPIEPTAPVEGKEISILFIGNSFSDDTEAYMVDILLNLGYTNIDIGNLYIGGCSIDTHYENILSGLSAYDFRMRSHNGKKYTEYETITVGDSKQSLAFAIAYKDWDIISVQQASGYSGQADSYKNLDALVSEVKDKATNPDVEFVFNMTWAYQADSTHAQFPDYNSDQMTMYNAIVDAVQSKVSYTVVPNATAIQNARTSFIGDNLTRDGYHLDLKIGRYIAGLTFVAKVTGADITDFDYVPNGVTQAQFEVAIESIQNAIKTPFAVTESEIKKDPYAIDSDSVITAGGSNTDAVSIYNGNVEDLGFAAGSEVFKYVGVDSATDKVAIKVDSANYDYVDVQFVIAEGDGYFFMHGLKGGNWHNSGASYVIDPSWIRIADGNNSSSDRTIQVFDAEGNKVTSLMSTNTLYTLRVFIKVGELDEIRISKSGSTIYLANVTQGLESELPVEPVEGPIKQGLGSTQTAMPTYTGDVTAHGFAEGEFIQYMVTETSSNVWAADPISGKTREQLAARIPGQTGKYLTIKFATSEDIASGSVFYVWGLLGETHTSNGALNFTTTTYGRILDVNGYPVSSIAKNTVYVLELYIEGTDTYKVANICATGMELYFAPDSITCSDESFEADLPDPDPAPDPDTSPSDPDSSPDSDEPQAPIVSGETTSTALKVYDGDETALGFASGTTVYELVSVDAWNDRVKIAADPSYKYLDVQFSVASGNWYFTMWVVNASGMLDGSYLVAENSGEGKQHATFGEGFAKHTPNNGSAGGNTRVQVLDANGNVVIGARNNGTVYTLRVWLEEEDVTEIQIGQANVTMYFGNIECTNSEPVRPITQGDGQSKLPDYTGDVTAHGFEEGEYLQYMVTETVDNAWAAEPNSGKTREQLAARIPGQAGKYVTIKFATSEDIASGSVFYVWGLLGSTYTSNGGLNFTTTTYGRILDEDGYPVSSIAKNTVYVLELYIEGTDTYKVSNLCKTGMELYFAPDSITYSDASIAVQLPGADSPITAGGTNKNAVTIYTGDETALGFADGSTVYKYVGETTNDKISIKVDSTNYDYVDVQMVFDAASTKTWFLGFVMSGSTYLNGADAYILSGDNIRFNSNSSNPLDREIKFLDKDGNVVSSALQTGVLYTLRVYIKANDVTEIQMRQTGVTVYLANVTHGIEAVTPEPVGPTAVEIKIGDDKKAPTIFDGDETAYGFAEGTEVVVVTLEAATDVDDKRLAMEVDSSKQYLAIDFALEFGLLGNIYVWTVTDGGERVLAATILADGGVDTGALVDVVIKDSEGNDATSEVLAGLDSGAVEKYTLYVYYDGADEVHIGCDDYDEEFGGNILYFANAECGNDEA